jgi:hypothetical protein
VDLRPPVQIPALIRVGLELLLDPRLSAVGLHRANLSEQVFAGPYHSGIWSHFAPLSIRHQIPLIICR